MSNIIIGISGGIAAYKVCHLIRLLRKNGHDVKAVMTENAGHFITRETIETLTQNTCHTTLWAQRTDTEHISLAKWGDMLVIAPATANIIGKCANGIADDLLSTLYLSFTGPVLFCPAMNVNMYNHGVVQDNLSSIGQRDTVMEPGEGFLACNDTGRGRMREPDEIAINIERILYRGTVFEGRTVIVTGGSVSEDIDPVRHIGNKSSGRMAAAMIRAAYLNKARRIVYIHGSINSSPPPYSVNIQADNADHMLRLIRDNADSSTVLIMAAAVSDFRPLKYSQSKIKKVAKVTLEMAENTDILQSLSDEHFIKIGFALETENGLEHAREKLKKKNLDYIVLNDDKALGSDVNKVTLIGNGIEKQTERASKNDIALKVMEWIKL